MSTPWLCESVRLSALWQTPEIFASALTWDTVVGLPPENREEQPRRGASRQVGPIGEDAVLELQTAPGRVDWLMSRVFPPSTAELSKFPSIGSPEEALARFDRLLFDKATKVYPAPRFALGLTAVRPAPDRDASYAELASLLTSIRPDLSGTSDFLFQINRPRPSSTLTELQLNRLSRWSSMQIAGVELVIPAIGTTGPVAATLSQVSKPLFATRVELDLSSAADRREPIPENARASLVREFSELALEILEKGDIP